jgi:salicylate hydroxylase
MRVAIVGAGIGGLTAAIALRRTGLDAHVYEQASILREVGAGIATSPNALKVLERLGLADTLREAAVISLSMDPRDWKTGDVLARVPLAEEAVRRWGAPFYHFHRADLHSILRAAVGDQNITLGARCISVEEDGSGATVHFADGQRVTADLVVGADGVHSVVREYVAGADAPTWARQVSWRGLADGDVGRAIGLEVRHHSFWGPGKQFVCFYVSGGRQVNWVGNIETDDDWREGSWSARGERTDALSAFEGWHPQIPALIGAAQEIFKWALFERSPLERWTRGRVTLLGDAAHPMLPFMAQGGSQSIEDAWVLARCLADTPNEVGGALERYFALRHERAAALQLTSSQMASNVQLRDPDEVRARNARMKAAGAAYAERYDWIWGYDADAALSSGGSGTPPLATAR